MGERSRGEAPISGSESTGTCRARQCTCTRLHARVAPGSVSRILGSSATSRTAARSEGLSQKYCDDGTLVQPHDHCARTGRPRRLREYANDALQGFATHRTAPIEWVSAGSARFPALICVSRGQRGPIRVPGPHSWASCVIRGRLAYHRRGMSTADRDRFGHFQVFGHDARRLPGAFGIAPEDV